jgi:glycosyltransferase involved in cell wall biosynthesis
MIKVLHIIKSLGRGGAEMLLPETLKLHNKNEFEFHYIYFLPWKNQMVDALQQAGGKVTCLAAKNNLAIMMQAGKLKQYIREQGIQLIHCHLPWAGFLGRYLHRSTGLPVIYSEHNKQERYHKITRFINKRTFNSMTAAVAVSQDVADSIQQHIKPSIPVKVILNGVNTNDFVRDESSGLAIRHQYHIPADAIVIGTIAVFRFQKRLKEWLEVFKKVSDKYPSVHAIIVGEGNLRPEIEAAIVQLQLKDKVLLAGLQTNVKPWLSAMDIFMMSSVFEGLPIALLEAMSMQCAIVTTDAGGIKEVISNNQHGLMTTVDEWPLLSEKLETLINDKQMLKQLAEKARERVKTHFSMQYMVKELESLYRQILNKQ